jgi:hypothetical protein
LPRASTAQWRLATGFLTSPPGIGPPHRRTLEFPDEELALEIDLSRI